MKTIVERWRQHGFHQPMIIRGAPGSGKSTLARGIAEHAVGPTRIIEPDLYHYYGGPDYQWTEGRHQMALEWAAYGAAQALDQGFKVIIPECLPRWSDVDALNLLIRQHRLPKNRGRWLRPMYVLCKGVFENIHGVGDEDVQIIRDRTQGLYGELMYRAPT